MSKRITPFRRLLDAYITKSRKSITAIANEVDADRTKVSKLLNGQTAPSDLGFVRCVATACGEDPEELVFLAALELSPREARRRLSAVLHEIAKTTEVLDAVMEEHPDIASRILSGGSTLGEKVHALTVQVYALTKVLPAREHPEIAHMASNNWEGIESLTEGPDPDMPYRMLEKHTGLPGDIVRGTVELLMKWRDSFQASQPGEPVDKRV